MFSYSYLDGAEKIPRKILSQTANSSGGSSFIFLSISWNWNVVTVRQEDYRVLCFSKRATPHNDLLIRCGAHWADSLFCTPPFLSTLTSQLSSSSQVPLAAAGVRPRPLQVTHRKGLKRRVGRGRGLCSEARQSPPARAGLHSSKNHSFQKAGIRQRGQRGRGAHEASSPWLDTQML